MLSSATLTPGTADRNPFNATLIFAHPLSRKSPCPGGRPRFSTSENKNGVADRSFGYAFTLGFDQTRPSMVRN
jgi:hypothetical protein